MKWKGWDDGFFRKADNFYNNNFIPLGIRENRDTVVLIFHKDEAYIIIELKACCFFNFLDFKSYGVKHW